MLFVLFRPIEGLKSTALYPTVKTVGFTAIFYKSDAVNGAKRVVFSFLLICKFAPTFIIHLRSPLFMVKYDTPPMSSGAVFIPCSNDFLESEQHRFQLFR